MKYLVLTGTVLFFLVACAPQEENNSGFICTIEMPQPQFVASTVPKAQRFSFNQQQLAQAMALEPTNIQCLESTSNRLRIFRGPTRGNVSVAKPVYANLPEATGYMREHWDNTLLTHDIYGFMTAEHDNGTLGHHGSTIIVRDDARSWHMWHEYIHFLIKQRAFQTGQFQAEYSHVLGMRKKYSTNPDEQTGLPTGAILERMRESIKGKISTSAVAEVIVQEVEQYYTLLRYHLDRNYIEEIVVEATIVDLIYENPQLVVWTTLDTNEANRFIAQTHTQLNTAIANSVGFLNTVLENTQLSADHNQRVIKAKATLEQLSANYINFTQESAEKIISLNEAYMKAQEDSQ